MEPEGGNHVTVTHGSGLNRAPVSRPPFRRIISERHDAEIQCLFLGSISAGLFVCINVAQVTQQESRAADSHQKGDVQGCMATRLYIFTFSTFPFISVSATGGGSCEFHFSHNV